MAKEKQVPQEGQAQQEWDNAFNPSIPKYTKTYAELMQEKEKANKQQLENDPASQQFVKDLQEENDRYMKEQGLYKE